MLAVGTGRQFGWDAVAAFHEARGVLGPWAAPAYVAAHALTLALCLPYAIFFEGGAALIFGFLPGVAWVFSAMALPLACSPHAARAALRPKPAVPAWPPWRRRSPTNEGEKTTTRGPGLDGENRSSQRRRQLASIRPLCTYLVSDNGLERLGYVENGKNQRVQQL